MRTRTTRLLFIVGASVAVLTACGSEEPAPSATTPSVSITSAPQASVPTPTATRVTPSTPLVDGTIVVESKTLNGVAVPNTAVTIQRAAECNAAQRDIPPGTTYTDTFSGATGNDGRVVFDSIPIGCYSVSAKPHANANPVPEGQHSAFLTVDARNQTVTFRFYDDAATDPCSTAGIVADLGVDPALQKATATVTDCAGGWAIIRWDAPGDTQRMIHHVAGKWTTYMVFPSQKCWKEAQSEGVPDDLKKYFNC